MDEFMKLDPAASGRARFGGAAPDKLTGKKRKRDESAHHRPKSRPAVEEEQEPVKHDVSKYERSGRVDAKHIQDKKHQRVMKHSEKMYRSAAQGAAQAEYLLTEEAGYLEAEGPMDKTYKFSQAAIAKAVDVGVSRKAVDLALETYGPYKCAYTRNGRYMLLGGAKGHVAVVDWNKFSVRSEFHVHESVHDVTFLHNDQFSAVAQRKYVYIYDHTGAEVHVLRNHVEPLAIDFLPYHFLLASVGTAGYLKYQDTSTGQLVAEHRTKLGACSVLRHNPWNAVVCCGHSNGAVTMWTPNMSVPVAKLVSHKAPVTALAVDAGGRYMVTAGMDSRVKVWDIRNFREVHDYFTPTPAHTLDVSQRGLVGIGYGSHVQIWGRDFALEGGRGKVTDPVRLPVAALGGAGGSGSSSAAASATIHVGSTTSGSSAAKHMRFDADSDDEEDDEEGESAAPGPMARHASAAAASGVTKAKAPYMRHELPGKTVCCLRFRPYDDICAVSHSGGLSSLVVPGAGEPNYDSVEANPFADKRSRQETEVHGLLDKIPSTLITLEPSVIGGVDRAAPAVKEREKREAEEAAAAAAGPERDKARKRRGIRKALKKQANIVTEQKVALQEKLREEQEARAKEDAKRAKIRAKLAAGGAGAGAGASSGGSGGAAAAAWDSSEDEGQQMPKSALSRFYKK